MKKVILFLLACASMPIATSAIAQGMTWSTDWGISNVTNIGSNLGRPGVSATSFSGSFGGYLNGSIWVAYSSSTCYTYGCEIEITSSPINFLSGALSNGFSTPTPVSIPGYTGSQLPGDGYGYAVSTVPPALTAQNGYLYLSFVDGSNINWLVMSQDGITWSAPYQLAGSYSTTWSPALTADTSNSARLWAGFADASLYTPIICTVYPNVTNFLLTTQTCYDFTSLNQMNFNPGLTYWSAVGYLGVVMAYEYRGNSHCLDGYVLNPETQYSYDYNASQNCSDQTSVVPSLAIQDQRLWLAWGGNNSARQFNVRYTDDGELDPIYKQTLSEEMNGSPTLLSLTYNNTYYLINFYAWNNQLRYLYGYLP